MLKSSGYLCIALLIALPAGGATVNADKGADAKSAAAAPKRELIYGSEIMTHGEREQYRVRMRGAKTVADEARIRGEHYGDMQKRARQRGVKLPDPPPAGAAK